MQENGQSARDRLIRVAMVVAIVVVAAASGAFAGPRLALHSPSWDFGYVPQRSHVSHRFWVHNDGDEPLVIDRIDVGCWCTGTSPLDEPIAPGDSASFLVTFNTSIIHGQVRKWIKLFTSVATGESERLWVRAYVVADDEPTGVYRTSARSVEWPVLRTDSTEGWVTARLDRARVDVSNLTDQEVTLTAEMCCSPCLDSVAASTTLAKHASSQVIVYGNVLADSATCAAPSVTLTLITQDTTRITLPIVIK